MHCLYKLLGLIWVLPHLFWPCLVALITENQILSLFSRFEIVLKTHQASAIVFLRAILRIAFVGYTRIRLDIFDAPNVNGGTAFKKRIDQSSKGRHTIVIDGKRDPNHSKYTEYRYSIDAEKHNLSY